MNFSMEIHIFKPLIGRPQTLSQIDGGLQTDDGLGMVLVTTGRYNVHLKIIL